jgi:hypothetical protein
VIVAVPGVDGVHCTEQVPADGVQVVALNVPVAVPVLLNVTVPSFTAWDRVTVTVVGALTVAGEGVTPSESVRFVGWRTRATFRIEFLPLVIDAVTEPPEE